MFEKVMVCLDGSKRAEVVLPYAIEEVKRFGSTLVLIQVLVIPDRASKNAADAPTRIREVIDDAVKEQKSEAAEYLEKIARPLREDGVDIEIVTLKPGHTAEALVQYAEKNSVNLICMSTHGHTGLARLIMGSIAEYVLKRSCLPMLMVRPTI